MIEEGLTILVNKPLNWTSFQVVKALRGAFKKTYNLKNYKVGHAGTLDPLATGLLIVCTGKKTKSINNWLGAYKSYQGIMQLGSTTPSYDLETDIDKTFDTTSLSTEAILAATQHFIGALEQYPPIFSAKKVDGKPLYLAARKGQEVAIKPSNIHIEQFDILNITKDWQVHFEVRCSKGTYIRSLAHDFGKYLQVGAHLVALKRTGIADITIDTAQTPTEIIENISQQELNKLSLC
jgi:tRNA pseudouridine55 synthase